MRLTSDEAQLLKEAALALDTNAKIYLFGSRTDDSKQGGDIDLLIISKSLNKREVRQIKHRFFDRFGEQKLDIVIDDGSFTHPFTKRIKPEAIEL